MSKFANSDDRSLPVSGLAETDVRQRVSIARKQESKSASEDIVLFHGLTTVDVAGARSKTPPDQARHKAISLLVSQACLGHPSIYDCT